VRLYLLGKYKLKLLIIISFAFFSMLIAEEVAVETQPVNYDMQLIKFYLQKNEFSTVIDYIENLREDNYITDSLNYYQALSYQGLNQWNESIDIFSELIKNSLDNSLIELIIPDFKLCIDNIDTSDQIEKISDILNDIRNDDFRLEMLFILAAIYEDTHFFEEANDVYKTILAETNIKEQFNVDLKIAANHILLKEYTEALEILDPIITVQDSVLNKDALFYSYIANLSLNNIDVAKLQLITLYTDFPEHTARGEIVESLADIFFLEKQYIMSWFLLNELKLISDPSKNFHIDKKIDQIRALIGSEELIQDQFQLLTPKFNR